MMDETEETNEDTQEAFDFFVKYTYSNECALLAHNFHRLSAKSSVLQGLRCQNDRRLISVTLMFVFFKYRVHHCDMALDLALTLTYIEDIESPHLEKLRSHDIFDVVCTLAYLSHVWNADRTIRLRDWYAEVAWRSFPTVKDLNAFVMMLFKHVRKYRLKVQDARVKRYVQRLCAMPAGMPALSSKPSSARASGFDRPQSGREVNPPAQAVKASLGDDGAPEAVS